MRFGFLPDTCFPPRPCAVPPHEGVGSPQIGVRAAQAGGTLESEEIPARDGRPIGRQDALTPDRGSVENDTALGESGSCLQPDDIAGGCDERPGR